LDQAEFSDHKFKEIADYIRRAYSYYNNYKNQPFLTFIPTIPRPGTKTVSGVDGANESDEQILEREVSTYS